MIAGRRTLAAASLAFATLLFACAAPKSPTPADPNAITIAAAGPMTGDLAVFGEQLRRGAQAAVDDINVKGGVLGKQLRLVLGDDQCDPRKAVGVASSLVDQ